MTTRTKIFRSTFVLFALCSGATSMRAQTPQPRSIPASAHPLTAADLIERMQKSISVSLPSDTVDTIKAGDPNTPVTGIATTFTPTMAVLRQAVLHGDNLIITHEPSFYNHRDESALFATDPVYLEKMSYIHEHGLVLFRFHDGWHLRQPDGIVEGWVRKVGWERFRKPGEQVFFTVPPTTLSKLAQQLQAAFGARIVRIVGDPRLKVTNIAYSPGASGKEKHIHALERDDVEVLIAGEASEWETVEYVRDAMQQGRHKALILLGHDTSEEIGMENCAQWLKTLFPTMKIDFLPAGEPYWLPAHPPAR